MNRRKKPAPSRADLEKLMSADLRALTARSDRLGRYFARHNDVSGNDFHALLHIMVSETTGTPLTSAQLRERMDVSAAAITYVVDRMIAAGHIRREPDPTDRRKSLLRYNDNGMDLGREFFSPLGAHLRSALADLPDSDLETVHRAFTAMMSAMSAFEDEIAGGRHPHSATKKTSDDGRATPPRRRGARPPS